MSSDLKKFEERRKSSLIETIGNTLWLGLEDLSRTMGFGKKTHAGEGDGVSKKKPSTSNQISIELDKYENMKIEKTKN